METLFKLLHKTSALIFLEVMSLINCMLFNANKNVQVSWKKKELYLIVWTSVYMATCFVCLPASNFFDRMHLWNIFKALRKRFSSWWLRISLPIVLTWSRKGTHDRCYQIRSNGWNLQKNIPHTNLCSICCFSSKITGEL